MPSRGAIVLAGGLGSRIKHLHPDLPKPLIEVGSRPFIEWVIDYLASQGYRDVVVSAGHLSQAMSDYFAKRPPVGWPVQVVVEPQALGTGGATLFAADSMVGFDPLLVANGDSIVLADLGQAHDRMVDPSIDGVLVGVRVKDASRFGSLELDAEGWLAGFREKGAGSGLVNAGLYLLRHRLLATFPRGVNLSLERDLIPSLLSRGARITVCEVDAPFLDIGTPESLAQATVFVQQHLIGEGLS